MEKRLNKIIFATFFVHLFNVHFSNYNSHVKLLFLFLIPNFLQLVLTNYHLSSVYLALKFGRRFMFRFFQPRQLLN